jgi:hypothetical protein
MNRFLLSLTITCIAPVCAAQSLITIGPAGFVCHAGGAALDGSQDGGTLLIRYDATAAILRVKVTNTSPASGSTPEIRRIWFGGPAGAVTQATLAAQDPPGRFDLAFAPAPDGTTNSADCFGGFMFQLTCSPRQLGVIKDPVEFTLQLDGPAVHLLDSTSFALATGQGGGAVANAALRFENGGNSQKLIVANSAAPLTAPASCVIYNGNNINPVDFTCLTLPVVGSIWQLGTSPNSNTQITILGMSLAPISPVPLLGGELLIDTGTVAIFFGPGVYQFAVPPYSGLPIYLQAARVDSGQIVILNAIHATLGF